jgi:membrane protease YdiL (CAAX protease family)
LDGAHTIRRRDLILNTLLVEGALAGLAVVLAWLFGPELWKQFHWSLDGVIWGCLGAIPPLVIVLLISKFPFGPLKHVADISDKILRPLLAPCRWPDYFLLATLAGFCEELLFRGWLQPFLGTWMPTWASLLLGGFVFGLCHLLTPAYFIIAWIISIYLGLLLVWSDNLLVPMVTHGVYDLIALFVVMWPEPKSEVLPPPVMVEDVSQEPVQ